MKGPFARLVAAMLAAALIGLPSPAAAGTSDTDESRVDASASSGAPRELAVAHGAALDDAPIRASVIRWASVESGRLVRQSQSVTTSSGDKCTASMAEKLAWAYALVGGSILVIYGPQEKNGDVWTMDGKSETVAGAAAIGLSFALLRDIRKRGW